MEKQLCRTAQVCAAAEVLAGQRCAVVADQCPSPAGVMWGGGCIPGQGTAAGSSSGCPAGSLAVLREECSASAPP